MENSETCGEIFEGQVRPVSNRTSEIPLLYAARADQQCLPLPDASSWYTLGFGLSEKDIQGPTLIDLALWEEGLRNVRWAQISV